MERALERKGAVGSIIGHPLRLKCLIALTERIASPAELARDFDERIDSVYYHLKKLEAAGTIELVRAERNHGGKEHFYKAVQRPAIGDEESEELSEAERLRWTQLIIQLVVADVECAIEGGTFAARADHHITRYPTSVDALGWKELRDLFEETYEQMMDIEARSAGRMTDPATEAIKARGVSLLFEMP